MVVFLIVFAVVHRVLMTTAINSRVIISVILSNYLQNLLISFPKSSHPLPPSLSISLSRLDGAIIARLIFWKRTMIWLYLLVNSKWSPTKYVPIWFSRFIFPFPSHILFFSPTGPFSAPFCAYFMFQPSFEFNWHILTVHLPCDRHSSGSQDAQIIKTSPRLPGLHDWCSKADVSHIFHDMFPPLGLFLLTLKITPILWGPPQSCPLYIQHKLPSFI